MNTLTVTAASESCEPPASDVQAIFKEQFRELAVEGERFHEAMRGLFGESHDAKRAEQLRRKALAGDFAWLPPVKWMGMEVLGGARGTYDAESGTVFLHRALRRDARLASAAYVEQLGHLLDVQLNGVDTLRDEGELFRRILAGERLPPPTVVAAPAPGTAAQVESRPRWKTVGLALSSAVLALGDVFTCAARAWAPRR